MISQNLDYAVGERVFPGYLSYDETREGRRPGVLVLHEGDGLSAYTKSRADSLAELGYVAFAPDLYGETFESRERGIAAIMALVQDSAPLRARTRAALQTLKSLSMVDSGKTAAIGFCFGGFAVLELARSSAELACAVCFHGGLAARNPAKLGAVACKILVCTGADDPFAPREQRTSFEEEMSAAGADWQMIVYGGAKHGFTNRAIDPAKQPGCAYQAAADKRSWDAMLALFEETLGGPPEPHR